jgi:hypothetical protein
VVTRRTFAVAVDAILPEMEFSKNREREPRAIVRVPAWRQGERP